MMQIKEKLFPFRRKIRKEVYKQVKKGLYSTKDGNKISLKHLLNIHWTIGSIETKGLKNDILAHRGIIIITDLNMNRFIFSSKKLMTSKRKIIIYNRKIWN